MLKKTLIASVMMMGVGAAHASISVISPSGAEFIISADGNTFIDVDNQREYIRPEYFLNEAGTLYDRILMDDFELDNKLYNASTLTNFLSLTSTFFGKDYSLASDPGVYLNYYIQDNGARGDVLEYTPEVVSFINVLSGRDLGLYQGSGFGWAPAIEGEEPSRAINLWVENDVNGSGNFNSVGVHSYQYLPPGSTYTELPYITGIDLQLAASLLPSQLVSVSGASLFYVRDMTDPSTDVSGQASISNVSAPALVSALGMLLMVSARRKRLNNTLIK